MMILGFFNGLVLQKHTKCLIISHADLSARIELETNIYMVLIDKIRVFGRKL